MAKSDRERERARAARDVPDRCRDCGTPIIVPGNRARGISRCNRCDLAAMNGD